MLYFLYENKVFATPAMIALMEQTAWMSIASLLSEGEGTVGTKLDVVYSKQNSCASSFSCAILPV